jgi:hypothetical protein
MRSFIPNDDESRDTMLVYLALFTAALLDPALKRSEAHDAGASMHDHFADLLRQERLRAGVDPKAEALVLVTLVTGLSQGVLDGQLTADQAFDTVDYSLARVLRQ